ncbi:hypothetical protein [uncultured Polaribacter sp.]|uniref:hypothetical protein n=1 Tax=uncultured Polaribacter sp. TaxID=174711 RepID=UPI00261D7A77|nr:hypothetical protein [uncultured Polaribacter sp.]
MRKKTAFFIVFFLSVFKLFANVGLNNNDFIEKKDSIILKNKVKTKSFEEFDKIVNTNIIQYQTSTSEFNQTYISENFPLDSIANNKILMAKAVMDDLDTSQNYVDLVSPDDLVTLPIGVKKDIGNITYTLGISQARITPEYTEVTAFVRIIIPQLDAQGNQKQLFFGANNIKLSHKGGIYGDANLVLLGDVPIPINGGNSMVVLKGGFDMQTGNVADLTYVTVDCGGFKELGITADVLFPRSMLEPVDSNYTVVPEGHKKNGKLDDKVTGYFQTIVSDWNDILVEVSLPPFQLTKENSTDGSGKAGLIFELNTAVFDFSDVRNSPNVDFPDGYDQYLVPGNKELWRGVYVKTLTVVLPKQFKKRKSEERVVFKASHLLIDGMGVSGEFSVDHILPITEGDASKWQFSVDHIEAKFVTNNLIGAGFDGKIVLPISNEITQSESTDSTAVKRKTLAYKAIIDPVNDDYLLTVATQDSLSFSVFKAKATLTPNSYIELRVSENKFRPKAVLHGNLAIKGSNSTTNPDKATIDFKGITFQNLQLQTESPYFQVDYMGYNGEVKFANFPVTISEIGVTANDNIAALHFDIDINLMESGFSGETSLSIVGKFNENDELQRWQYDRIDMSRIAIGADLGSIQINGFVDIKDDDPVYGDGFYGELGATFNGISVEASAWFGKTDFRYWYVDAYANLSEKNVKIGPTLKVNGFGGGAYYHMSKAPNPPMQIYDGKPVTTPGPPSGVNYYPDVQAGLGFRALLGFALANEKAFNGKVGFEMAFNTSGGLNRVLFFGEGHMMKVVDFKFGDKFKEKLTKLEDKINSLGENNEAINSLKESNLVDYSKVAFPQDGLTFDVGIDAHFSMEMDFQNDTFHAEMETFVNTPGGFFKGVGPQGRAGWAVFHIAPSEWYLHLGTPQDRIGLKLGIGSFNVQATTYLMIGDNIPGSPPPPDIVADILGVQLETLDYMRDLNALGDGRGFAFGADLSVDTGDMTFLVFYARFQAGLGFDIMVKDYGETACEGSGAIGIDGWYANGQAYAYLQGELGIKVKLLFIRKKIPIIKAGAAVLLQAKLPNPAWFRGYVGGHFNLLGGLVKGRFRFKIELGEECEIVGGAPLGGLKVISDVKPDDGTNDVDVFTVPQAVFNMRINHPFDLEDDKGVKTYRILLEEYTITKEGVPIEGDLQWNENNDVVNFVSSDILPPNTSLNIKVKVNFQELQGGYWVTLTQNGKPAVEIEERNFTTGEAPDYIPLTNIVYSYPVIDQDYFYQNERSSGYVKLVRGQPYLFTPETDWTQTIQFESDLGIENGANVSYSQSQRLVNFDFPTFENQKEYTLRIVSTSPNQDDTNSNEEDTYTSQNTGQDGTTIEVRNREAETVVREAEDVEILVYNFKTSAHNTFAEKIQAKQATQHYLEPIYSDVHTIQTDVQSSERFSLLELNGDDSTNYKALVETEAVLDDAYYTNSIYQLIYQGYPLQPQFTVDRDVTELGIPPKKGINILTWYPSYLENNSSFSLLDTRIPYRYYLPYHYKQDFIDIQYKVVNAYLNNTSQYQSQIQQYNYIINGVFPSIKTGNYKVKMQYILPGDIKGSSAIFNYNNPF